MLRDILVHLWLVPAIFVLGYMRPGSPVFSTLWIRKVATAMAWPVAMPASLFFRWWRG